MAEHDEVFGDHPERVATRYGGRPLRCSLWIAWWLIVGQSGCLLAAARFLAWLIQVV